MSGLHRDDMPMEAAEEIVSKIKELHPGMEVVFAGDLPEDQLPPGLAEMVKQIDEANHQSLTCGLCIDCGEQMPGWADPSIDIQQVVRENMAAGWRYFTKGELDPEPCSWQCPACDAKDTDGTESEYRPFGSDGAGEVRPEDGAPGSEVHGGDGG